MGEPAISTNGMLGRLIISLFGAALTGLTAYAIASSQDRYTATDAARDLTRLDRQIDLVRDDLRGHAGGPPHSDVAERLSSLEAILLRLERDRDRERPKP